eukprot:scaffold120044_cov19-Prasinocladus_malaysianus.AAC.2
MKQSSMSSSCNNFIIIDLETDLPASWGIIAAIIVNERYQLHVLSTTFADRCDNSSNEVLRPHEVIVDRDSRVIATQTS